VKGHQDITAHEAVEVVTLVDAIKIMIETGEEKEKTIETERERDGTKKEMKEKRRDGTKKEMKELNVANEEEEVGKIETERGTEEIEMIVTGGEEIEKKKKPIAKERKVNAIMEEMKRVLKIMHVNLMRE